MKLNKAKATDRERQILAGMIVSTAVIAKIASKWPAEKGLFKAKWPNVVGELAVEYYNKYGKAPGKTIKRMIDDWSQTARDPSTVELVETFLEKVSDEYAKTKKEINPEYVIDVAGKYFTQVKLERLRDDIESGIDSGKTKQVLDRVRHFDDVRFDRGAGVDVLRDTNALKAAFDQKVEPLITLKGAAGNFFGTALCRDGFVLIEAPEKTGKTTLIQELSWQGMNQGRRTSFIGVGDESEADMMLRFAVRAAMQPLEATDKDEPVKYPTFIEPVGKGKDHFIPDVQHDIRHFRKFLNFHVAKRALRRTVGKLGSKECLLKLYTYPNFTVSMRDVLAIVRDEERAGQLPDIVCLDYMDILAPPSSNIEIQSRDQINMNYMLGRRMSQEYHCLFLTGSQVKRTAYEAEAIGMEHTADDKRKIAHVTMAIGMNQSDDEKRRGVMRLNIFARRKGRFDKKVFLYCGTCMEIGNPMVVTTY